MSREVPVFLCYRQEDGLDVANLLYDLLHNTQLPDGSEIDLYFDRATTPVGDWTRIHLPFLKLAEAMVVIVTPGSRAKLRGKDWVEMELDWWVANRDTSPIVVDPNDLGDRWIPEQISKKWPNCQRVNVTWTGERITHADRVRKLIHDGIRTSGSHYLYQELQEQKRVRNRLTFATALSTLAAVVAMVVLCFALLANWRLQESLANNRLLSQLPFRSMPSEYSEHELGLVRQELKKATEVLQIQKVSANDALDVRPQLVKVIQVLQAQIWVHSLEAELHWAHGRKREAHDDLLLMAQTAEDLLVGLQSMRTSPVASFQYSLEVELEALRQKREADVALLLVGAYLGDSSVAQNRRKQNQTLNRSGESGGN